MVDMSPQRAGLPIFKPTPRQEKLIREGLAFLGMTAQLWSNILYSELEVVYTAHPGVPLAATDGHRVFFNPDNIIAKEWTIENMAFVHAHEVMHYVRADLIMAAYWNDTKTVVYGNGKVLPYIHDLMNRAMDYVINAGLKSAGIGDMPKEALYDPNLSLAGMESSIDVYATLYEENKAGRSRAPGGFDIHLEADPDMVHEEKYGNGKEKRELAIAAAYTASQGNLPGFMQRIIGDILQPKVRWEDQLATSMTRSAGEPGHDWSKFNKRLIVRGISFARRIAKGAGTIVIGADTSGSINAKTLDRFFAEAAGIVSALQPRELYVMWCDTQINRVDYLEDPQDLKDLHQRIKVEGTGGGGGSNMTPIFDTIKEMGLQPDCLVVLTDLLVKFPEQAPAYDTIWCSIRKDKRGPFGRTIYVEV